MAIVQEAFYIPDDIAIGLTSGQLKRFGGVVRYATGSRKGRIAKHLDPVTTDGDGASKGFLQSVSELIGEHKKLTIGVLVTAAGVGTLYYFKNKEPKVVRTFRITLKRYLDHVRVGNVDSTCIQDLMDALAAMKAHKNYEKICVKLTAEELGELVSHICDYTLEFAEKNGKDISNEELDVQENQFDSVVMKLQRCLETQKRIFDEAA